MKTPWTTLTILALVMATALASAASLTLSSSAPIPGTNDVYNLTGASRDGANVGDGAAYVDGGANDGFTYVAGDRPDQGQTFTTGSNTNGYLLNAVWLRHAGYTNNTALTWWQMNSGVILTVRVTDPAQAGTSGFALHAETYTTTGSEGWVGGYNSTNGDGDWVRVVLASPVTLTAGKTYGFDLTSATTGTFFEWLGTSNSVYAGGAAYRGSTSGTADNVLNSLAGDRVFLVELAVAGATNASATTNSVAYSSPLSGADNFPNDRVQLLASRFWQNRELHHTGYLGWLNTNADRLLWPFRNNAGLTQPSGASNLGGWEGTSGFTAVRGHIVGHFLSAAAREYADTGDTNFLNTINYLVTELRKCQNALSTNEIAAGLPYGYLSAFPSTYFSVLETNPLSAQVPFYTVHKILAGLVDVYRYTTNDLALNMAIAMSDYHQARMAKLTAAQIEAMFVPATGATEWGGMNEALTDLYLLSNARGDTNAARHLAFAEVFHRDWFIGPLSTNVDILNGLHANTHIPQVVGFARVASVLNTNDTQRDRLYSAASNFWHQVVNQHWLVLGGNSYSEHFSTPGLETGTGGSALAWNTAETCNTYNMLKLTRQLFQHTPSVEYADYYEHALYNHILAGLETNHGMMTYFVPMNSGHFKTYCQPTGSCWCCQGTGIENPTRYNEAIYFHKTNVLWVNLFIPSILNWSEQGLTVRLDTGFPATNSVQLTFQCAQPTNAAVRIRIPHWIAATPSVLLNGVSLGLTPAAGTYLELNRTWTNGDMVTLTLPMNVRVDHSMDDNSQVSLFYGPILLAAELGTNGMPATDEAPDQGTYSSITDVAAPLLVGDNANSPTNWVSAAVAPLVFNVTSAYTGATSRSSTALRPFYDVHHVRYAVYWDLIAPSGLSIWSGAGGTANWSGVANWNLIPTNQCQVQFGLAAGGTTTNDLAAGTQINGIQFPAGAGSYTLNGNAILLQGDVVNSSANEQRLNFPVQLTSGPAWNLNAASGNLTVGNIFSGNGVINKQGAYTLTVLSNFTFNGSLLVTAGALQVGNGGSSGSLGSLPVMTGAGTALIFDRSDTYSASNTITGAGSVILRGSGTLQWSGVLSNTGPTILETGKWQIVSQAVSVLKHRWSFNGNLNDSIGTNTAVVVDVGANNTTLSASTITLAGGSQSASDYVALGSGLLPQDGSPLTIELWGAQLSAQSWSRIFDIGSSSSDYLFMGWSQGTDTTQDRIEWKDAATTTANNTCAPYIIGAEYHIALMVQPGGGSSGNTRVIWYAAPVTNSSLGAARATFDTANTLANLNATNFWLGRSEYSSDSTANASYDEVRLWNRAFTTNELQQLHGLGPDALGAFATNVSLGALSASSDFMLGSGTVLDLGGSTQQVASVAGAAGSVIQLNGGQFLVGPGTNTAVTFAGAFTGAGGIQVNGTLRLVGNASLATGVTLTNNGTLDIMTWSGALPANFVNHGTILDRSLLKVGSCQLTNQSIQVNLQGYAGHAYQLQSCTNLATGNWVNLGSAVTGNDTVIQLVHTNGISSVQRFYRVAVNP